jgi:hypothetical protein
MQYPGDERDNPSHQKPSRAKQIDGASNRMAHPDWSGEHRASLLEQETQVGAQRRPQRKDQSQDHLVAQCALGQHRTPSLERRACRMELERDRVSIGGERW